MLRYILSVLVVLISSGWKHGGDSSPCGLVNCVEAYSVVRSLVSGYKGPLFQLTNRSASTDQSSTLDIGQTASGVADMSTWSAFCSGVQSNCWISKIYAQVHHGRAPGGNDLEKTLYHCTGNACQTPFKIEAATGLPIFQSTLASNEAYSIIVNTTDPNSGWPTTDGFATGVNGPGQDLSIILNGHSVTEAMCCGPFGIGHYYLAPDTLGTDFFIALNYGQFGVGGSGNNCATTTTYCIGIDEESIDDMADYGSSPINLIGIITYSQSANKVTAALNGTQLINKTPATALSNNGNTIHLTAGGDLTQPSNTIMREILVSNVPLSATQQAAIIDNMRTFYAPFGVTFP